MINSESILGPINNEADVATPPVIILIYEGWQMAINALKLHYGQYPNIWVVDNHSPTDYCREVQNLFPNVRVFRTAFNGGWAYAYNQAIAQAIAEGYRTAYLLNSDAVPADGAVESALALLEKTPRAAAVGSQVLSWDGQTIEFDGGFYAAGSGPLSHGSSHSIKQVERVHGAGMAISFAAFSEVGPFREEYFLYHEETDWLIRALNRGWTLWVDGRSTLRHIAGGSMSGGNSRYYLTRNHFLAFRRGTYLGGRAETFWSVLWEEAGKMYDPDPDIRFAVRQGIVHGIWDRTGQRPANEDRLSVFLQTIPIRLTMKLRGLIRQNR